MKVAIVGAGIMGSSAALQFAERGHDVVVFEQFADGHKRGSSHGRSRIVRKAYPDRFYTEIMMEAYPMWHELDARAPGLLHECGLVYFGSSTSEALKSQIAGLSGLGVPFEVLEGGRIAARLPGVQARHDEIGIWTPEAGWVEAERALHTLRNLAKRYGAQFVTKRIDDLEQLESIYDMTILCAGPWMNRFLDLPLQITVQCFAYIEGAREGPVWIEDSELNLYGFPSEPGQKAFKVGHHRHGPVVDPDHSRETQQNQVDALADLAGRRFGIAHPKLEVETCLYTNTSDEDFRLGRVGEKILFASACSGHGFKFGPWIGRLLADLAEDKRSMDEFPRFQATPTRLS